MEIFTGNPATVGVVRWPAAGDIAGSSLRRLSFLQHRIYDLLAPYTQGDNDVISFFYLCQPVFADLLSVKLGESFGTVISLKYALLVS